MIQTSTTRWLTPLEVIAILPETPLERIVGWAEKGHFWGSWQGPDGWLMPADTAESWRRSSDFAKAVNAARKIEVPTFDGDEQDFRDMMEDAHWHHKWFDAATSAAILGITAKAMPSLELPKAQELPDGSWRFDDLTVERRRRVLIEGGDPNVNPESIRHHHLGDGHVILIAN